MLAIGRGSGNMGLGVVAKVNTLAAKVNTLATKPGQVI